MADFRGRRPSSASVLFRGHRRASNWLASFDITGSTTLAAASVRLDQSFTQAQIQALGPFTVVRTRGQIWTRSDQTAGSESAFGALGFMVVREQARAAGVGSVPTPLAEESDDGWFVHQFFPAGLQVADATGMVPHYVTHFDSRAQRKVSPDDAIVVVLENGDATSGLAYVLKFRMLIKLA